MTVDYPISRIGDHPGAAELSASRLELESLRGRQACPFCGTVNSLLTNPCPHCGMEDSNLTRQATEAAVGPWYVQQNRNPSAPGMRYSMLLTLIRKGQVRPGSVLRGPTTRQLWDFAIHIRGISREFGLCYSCGGEIPPGASACRHCGQSQDPPPDPGALLDFSPGSSTVFREISAPPPPPTPQLQPLPRPELLSAAQLAKAFQLDGPEPPAPVRPPIHRRFRHFGWMTLGALPMAVIAAGILYMNWPASHPVPAPRSGSTSPAALADPVASGLVRTFWQNAIEAESHQDYSAAVYYYEQIEKLSSSVHPPDLQTRLTAARAKITR